MRVAIEAASLALSSGGLARYTSELSLALAREFPDDEYYLVSDQPFRMPDGAPPNSGKLPAYATMGVALIHEWKDLAVGNLEGRVGITNLFDKTYLLRDGTGVGVGAPQYGGRRTWFAALTQRF